MTMFPKCIVSGFPHPYPFLFLPILLVFNQEENQLRERIIEIIGACLGKILEV